MNIGYKVDAKPTNVANTLMARDFKGIGNQAMTAVIYEKNSDD